MKSVEISVRFRIDGEQAETYRKIQIGGVNLCIPSNAVIQEETATTLDPDSVFPQPSLFERKDE